MIAALAAHPQVRARGVLALVGAIASLTLPLIGPPSDLLLVAGFAAAVLAADLLPLDFPDRRGVSVASLPLLFAVGAAGPHAAVWAAAIGSGLAALLRLRQLDAALFSTGRAALAAATAATVIGLLAPGRVGAASLEAAAPATFLYAIVLAGTYETLGWAVSRAGAGVPVPRLDPIASAAIVPLVLVAWLLVQQVGTSVAPLGGAGLLGLFIVVRSAVNTATRNADLESMANLARDVTESASPAASLGVLWAGLPRWVDVHALLLLLPGPDGSVAHHAGDSALLQNPPTLTTALEAMAARGPTLYPGHAGGVVIAPYGRRGVLFLARRHNAFSIDELSLLRLLLGHLSAVLEQVRLVDDLGRAMSALRAAQAERDDFLNVMTHDLRQPLAGMLGYAQLLERGLDAIPEVDSRLRRYAAGVRNGGERVMRMIDNLLEIARMESGTIELEPRVVQLLPLVDDVVDALAATIEAKRQTVRTEAPADLPAIQTAEPLLREVLANLVGNAVKYTPDCGSIDLRISVDDGYVEIAVADTGIGIPPDALSRVFTRFFRTGQEEVRALRGSGLGLALTKTMVERIGGSISVESTLGSGSTFTVRLPLVMPS